MKNHLLLLDGLRGIAALIVLWYHTFEGFATSLSDQRCNHGYLAVDFFFMLSGFVIAYSYDQRLQHRELSLSTFFKRRLIRLHPMVVVGVLIGLVTFLIQGGAQWDFAGDGHPVTPGVGWLMLAVLLNLFLLPNIPGQPFEVRGNGELFPLNGPHWSLFFEYIGNIIYALFLCRISTRLLTLFTILSGGLLGYITISSGYLGVGWTLPDFWSGLVRLLFPYCMGMLLARLFITRRARSFVAGSAPLTNHHGLAVFVICSLALLILLPMPFVGSEESLWQNGLYVTLVVTVIFPLIIWLSANGSKGLNHNTLSSRVFQFLGNISYPLYAIHYPSMYLFYYYIGFPHVTKTFAEVWPVAACFLLCNIVLATLLYYFYEKPVRRMLSHRA